MAEMIEIQHLSKSFGPLVAVDDVSFSVERGEVLGFLGPNGAGKSTTMKMVAGYLAPTGGSARVCGADVGRDPIAVQHRIGYLPEGAPAYPEMTVLGFLGFVAEMRRIPRAERSDRIRAVVDQVHLESVVGQTVETLSRGYRRRVGIAQALIHDPEVLILDEPTDGLDPNQKHEVRELVARMAERKAIVLSTHILEEVDAVCTRAIIINEGRIVADGTPDALRARSPRHNAVLLTLSSSAPDSVRSDLAALDGVAGVEPVTRGEPNGSVSWRVLPADGRAIAADVAELSRDRGWPVHELVVEPGRLDDVFRSITSSETRSGKGSVSR